jgi:hypothetical protein
VDLIFGLHSELTKRAKPFSVRMTIAAVRYGVEDAGHPAPHAPASDCVQQWCWHTPAPSFESIANPAFACSMHLLSGGMAVAIRAFMHQRAGRATFRC